MVLIRTLDVRDVPTLWSINEEGVPGVGQITSAAMEALLGFSSLALGVDGDAGLRGFVLCIRPGSAYDSPNYRWFQARYDSFLYVDRVAVAAGARDSGCGSLLYRAVFEYADLHQTPVMAEVNVRPPNPGSLRFHTRHGFVEVGQQDHGHTAVTMLRRDPSAKGLDRVR